jgi:hypothetical protein
MKTEPASIRPRQGVPVLIRKGGFAYAVFDLITVPAAALDAHFIDPRHGDQNVLLL